MTRARDLARFANNQALSVDGDLEVGINSTSPAARLDVRGNVVITGVLTATTFVGDGSNLTGVSGFATALSSSQSSPLFNVLRHQGDLMSVQEHQSQLSLMQQETWHL